MKTFLAVIPVVSCVLLFPCDADAARPLQPRPAPVVPEAKPWTPKANSAHETTWQSVTLATNSVTMKVTEIQHEFVELGIGLNVPLHDGTLLRANPSFALTPNGAEANLTLHRVRLAPDINADGGAVQVTTIEGVVIRSTPLSFGYFDPVSGKCLILGVIQSARGWLVASNAVVYSNCFSGVRASLYYRNQVGGFSQNLLLHEAPMPPGFYGLSSRSRLELWTEFPAGTAVAVESSRTISSEENSALRAVMNEPDFVDSTLLFSGLRMAEGRAFAADLASPLIPANEVQAPVGKSFHYINGKYLLIEGAEFEKIHPALTNLPLALLGPDTAAVLPRRLPPLKRMAGKSMGEIQRVAETGGSPASGREYALVIDYEGIPNTTLASKTFKGDTTYYINPGSPGTLSLSGTTVLEGGAVLKFASGATLKQASGTIDCRTTNWYPAVFTSAYDSSVGEVVASGTPTTTTGKGFEIASGVDAYLHDLRFSFLGYGIFVDAQLESPAAVTRADFRHIQFVKCGTALGAQRSVFLGNALIFEPQTAAFEGASSKTITNVHVTVNTAPILCAVNGTALFTNCLLIQIAANTSSSAACDGNKNGFNNGFTGTTTSFGENAIGPSGISYPLVGISAGSNYLHPRSPYIHQGTLEGVPSDLLASIHQRTTTMPALLSGELTADTTLRPLPLEDTVEPLTPNLGYHYTKIDYLVSGWETTAHKITVLDGTVIAIDFHAATFAIKLNAGELASSGSATKLNRFIRSYAVQEHSLPNSIGGSTVGGFTCLPWSGSQSTVRLNFTDLSLLSGTERYFDDQSFIDSLDLVNSQFHGGKLILRLYQNYENGMNAWWRNCLFDRTECNFQQLGVGYCNLYNNTFYEAPVLFYSGGAGWVLQGNLFYGLTINEGQFPIYSSYNTCLNTTPEILTNAPGPNSESTPFTFENGPLGRFYIPATGTSSIINNGGRTAAAAGLAHFTTQVSQTKEISTDVDVGFHYVALDSSGKPFDSDMDDTVMPAVAVADGLPDYLEDPNGNGTHDTGETDWEVYMTDGLRSDYQKYLENSMTPKPFVLTWKMSVTGAPYGAIVRGAPAGNVSNTDAEEFDDYAVHASANDGEHPQVMFYYFVFNGYSKGRRLGNWHNGDKERSVRFFGPVADSTERQYAIVYDMSTVYVYVDGVLQTSTWVDNMTETLGVYNESWRSANYVPAPVILGVTSGVTVTEDSQFVSNYAVSKLRDEQWDGVVGNNSSEKSGLEHHSGHHPIWKMVSLDDYVAYTTLFYEGHHAVSVFHKSDVHRVVTNFPYLGDPEKRGFDGNKVEDLLSDGSAIYVKYADGFGSVDKWTLNSGTGEWTRTGNQTFPTALTLDTDISIANVVSFAQWSAGPSNGKIWAVYDGDTEQIKIYAENGQGSPLRTIGVANGYDSGPEVTDPGTANFANNVKLSARFWDEDEPTKRSGLTFQTDGKLWICDTVTGRAFRLDPANSYALDTWFMFLPKSYATSVDPNSPNTAKRVFNQYLEFEVDHSETSFEDAWTLKNYWGHKDVTGEEIEPFGLQGALFSVTTLSNGKTYALTHDPDATIFDPTVLRMAELVPTIPAGGGNPAVPGGLRFCSGSGLTEINAERRLEADGSMLFIAEGGSASQRTFERKYISSFTGADPVYANDTSRGPITIQDGDPIGSHYLLTDDKIIVFQPDRKHLGYHLGALSKTSTPQWLWKTCTTGPLDGKGKFDPFCEYAGTGFTVIDDHILCVYSGEFWRSSGQANQIFDYSTDGNFVRQFGTPKKAFGHEVISAPGAALNIFTISAVEDDGTIYIYTNDESGRGIHRWSVSE